MAKKAQTFESVTLGHIRSHGCRRGYQLQLQQRDECPDHLPDDLLIGSLCLRMVCARCGHRGADVRPDWGPLTNKRHPWLTGR